ncbi:MAG TPA: SAM-dependent methyltransferase [Gallionella sp.]|nr:SAM-dependent methyltransferase [Gallionella sp.]
MDTDPIEPPVPTAPTMSQSAPFNIVGLGASAGGLEAFEMFFHHMPADSGMAFVIVSHLDPGHASILTEILQRTTSMRVVEIEDQTKVEPDTVYVIPPNRDLAIFHGVLQLSVPGQPRGQRLPIDAFFRTLADDLGELAVGIILSGTGTDGTLGLRAILGAGGVSLVQEPASAKYNGMPESAIKAGFATRVLPVEHMPAALLSGIHTHLSTIVKPVAATGELNRILMQLRNVTGHDFSQYKKSTIGRRIERRMSMHDIDSLEVYGRYLKEHPEEAGKLFKELLINVTSFFRDAEAFDALKNDVLPQLLADKPDDYVVRIWVAGCATGEEAYSIAILLFEWMENTHRTFKVLLFATDLDDDAVTVARSGLYPLNIAQDVSAERLRRYFIKEGSGFRVKKSIREMVVFAIQNVIKDPPFTRLDLLSCRNLMIYLEPEVQSRLIPAFHYALNPGGVLFLSPSESIGNYPDLFTPINRKWKFYRASGALSSTSAVMAGGLVWARNANSKEPEEMIIKPREINFAELTRRMLLQSYAPASVVTDENGTILYVHGDTGRYLRPAPGQATLNLVEMARDGLQLHLRNAISTAINQAQPTLNHEVPIKSNGEIQNVSFSVRQMHGTDSRQRLLLVSFQDIAPAPAGKRHKGVQPGLLELARVEELERELTYTKEHLQGTIEEQQASNEELKSTNEELQSTNEELQSTNEELETSKEELQSVNEELVTVNAELQSKIELLALMQNDMKNLLDSINIGTLFLDNQLKIKRITRESMKLYRLVATDIGRPLSDIKSNIPDIDLLADAQTVLDTLVPFEREVTTSSGACYLARIQPYRTLDNVIDGVVLTFTDITQRRQVELAIIEARELAEGIVNTVREPLLVLDGELRVVSASRSFYKYFNADEKETIGSLIYLLGNKQWDIPELRDLLETILSGNQVIENFVVDHQFPFIGQRKLLLNARRLTDGDRTRELILLVMEEAA